MKDWLDILTKINGLAFVCALFLFLIACYGMTFLTILSYLYKIIP